MIQQLLDTQKGKSVAVVGSSPTAVLFDPGHCDVSIGVNATALLGHRFSYYLCSNFKAPNFDWFSVNCSECRIIAFALATMDYFLYPKEFDEILPERVAVPWPRQYCVELPPPPPPHYAYYVSEPTEERIGAFERREATTLMARATITGQAVQLAYIMGASQIHLYGCSFSYGSEHYFHSSRSPSGIQQRQVDLMNRLLSIVRKGGVEVVAYGPTALSEYDRILDG